MPGLFALNERVILAGRWRSGFFSFAAVGAYNVGSIHLSMHKVTSKDNYSKFIIYIFCFRIYGLIVKVVINLVLLSIK